MTGFRGKTPTRSIQRKFCVRHHVDLTDFDLSTVSLAGRLLLDDALVSVTLNGITLPVSPNPDSMTWGNFTVLTGSADLLAGNNTLAFTVYNGPLGYQTGVRVEVAGNGLSTVPEPSTSVALLVASLVLAGVKYSRTAKQA